jgi:hypothetical protein
VSWGVWIVFACEALCEKLRGSLPARYGRVTMISSFSTSSLTPHRTPGRADGQEAGHRDLGA